MSDLAEKYEDESSDVFIPVDAYTFPVDDSTNVDRKVKVGVDRNKLVLKYHKPSEIYVVPLSRIGAMFFSRLFHPLGDVLALYLCRRDAEIGELEEDDIIECLFFKGENRSEDARLVFERIHNAILKQGRTPKPIGYYYSHGPEDFTALVPLE